MRRKPKQFKYPGIRQAMDGNTAIIMCERESSDAAGAYPITPSTNMGEYWAEERAKGHINISGRPLIFIEPEGEHAAAGVTAGMSMTGLRAINFSSAQGIAYMHESLYAAAGKRLTYILNIGCRAITKASLNVHASHDDYHSVDDTGFFQVMGKSAQEACDLNVMAHKIAELALNPGIVAQDGFLTTHLIESLRVPERELIAEFLGRPDEIIETPTPAQRMIFGETRRRIPELWDVNNPLQSGTVQNQDAYMQSVAAQRPFFFDHVVPITEQVMNEYYELTGRRYNRIACYREKDADYLIVCQGSAVSTAEVVADYLRKQRGIKVGVVNMTMFRPFPGDLLGHVLKGRKGVAVLERTDQPLAEDLPLMREVRASVSKCVENQHAGRGGELPYPAYATYSRSNHTPPLYSGCFGLGSRDLQPEGLVGTVENMLPDGARKRFFYLSIDFVHDKPDTAKQEIYQQELVEAYPRAQELAVKGSENPNLMPEGCITVRMHSVGGWGAMTTGKNLAMTLFDLLDYEIKANPKYGSEKKGQPTTYYLSAAPEPIRVNCEYIHVDVVLSPDPNVFGHSNPLVGLKRGGVFVIQSDASTPEKLWESIPVRRQRYIAENDIRVFYLDAFQIARDEASDVELQLRMQGIAFQGAFFKASSVREQAKLSEKALFQAIQDQVNVKFASKGARVVEDNMRVVRRGFDELLEVTDKNPQTVTEEMRRKRPAMPVVLREQPVGDMPVSNLHRFWEQTGNFYVRGRGNDNLTDPFIAMSLVPAATGLFRDMTQIRFDYPEWLPENCTACGDCYAMCPDSAIPGLVNTTMEVFDSVVDRVERNGHALTHLRRALRTVDKKMRKGMTEAGEGGDVRVLLSRAVEETLEQSDLEGEDKKQLEQEFAWFNEYLGEFQFALTKPYFSVKERQSKGSGGLFSVTVNPFACKGCMECIEVCEDDALVSAKQTPETIERLRADWDIWRDLPTTSPDYIRIDDLDERIGALETLLLDKTNHDALVAGDGACLGCGEKTVIHLFVATVTALMQPRVKQQMARLDDLIARLEKHVRLKLAETMDLSDIQAIEDAVADHTEVDLTLSGLSASLDKEKACTPIDPDWVKWATHLLAKLKELRWQYSEGVTKGGQAHLGFINATGCTSVWGSTYPYNPYPFPWTSHLFQDSPSVAMGIFEGHMTKMAEGFKAIRLAEMELAGEYKPIKHDEFFRSFDWRQFSDEEYRLCPPVVSVGGDGAMYDIGFQNLSRMLMSGMPIKVLVLDTQVYSNTGGQACTSGFMAQVSDMAPHGRAVKGKEEMRKEMSLIAMAHRTSYVLQGTIHNVTHLLEGFIEGLNARRPALFNIYSVCQPEHGVADDASRLQSKLAVESRAYPLLRFNPDAGSTWADCCDLDGNPARDEDWPSYTINYLDEDGKEATLDLPMTFADFAMTEGRFRKHFRTAPRDTWNENMCPLSEFLELDSDDQEERIPYLWAVGGDDKLLRVIPSDELVQSTEERRDHWRLLRSVAGGDGAGTSAQAADQVRSEMAKKLSAVIMEMAGGGDIDVGSLAIGGSVGGGNGSGAAPEGYEPVWIDTPECTSCDECVDINPKIFAYNDKKLAVVVDPRGGPYRDIVRSAEKCTAAAIHPGTPPDPGEKDVEKLVKRATKYQ